MVESLPPVANNVEVVSKVIHDTGVKWIAWKDMISNKTKLQTEIYKSESSS